VQLFDHHREQGVHILFFCKVLIALLGLDDEHDVSRRRYVATVDTQEIALGDFRVVYCVTPVAKYERQSEI